MNVRCYFPLAAVLMVVLFGGCASMPSRTPAVTDPSAADVRQTLQAYVAARQARDIAAVEAVLDPSVDQLTSRGEWRRGVDAATAGMKRSTSQNPGDRTLTVETVRFLRPDVALADARYVIAGTDGAADRIMWSCFTLVMGTDGKWRITSIRNQKPAD